MPASFRDPDHPPRRRWTFSFSWRVGTLRENRDLRLPRSRSHGGGGGGFPARYPATHPVTTTDPRGSEPMVNRREIGTRVRAIEPLEHLRRYARGGCFRRRLNVPGWPPRSTLPTADGFTTTSTTRRNFLALRSSASKSENSESEIRKKQTSPEATEPSGAIVARKRGVSCSLSNFEIKILEPLSSLGWFLCFLRDLHAMKRRIFW
mmetsp:Transcript_20913/g.49544  ORF Transcript_20913/g.49544 Transcript_20913/m.49544 type:complete len:206 (+) Transcript_20913:338-955(+)